MLGYKARWAALALGMFLISTTLIFHTTFSDQLEMIMFVKVGGLRSWHQAFSRQGTTRRAGMLYLLRVGSTMHAPS
jgi:uncharacterized membrane protein YphA (DoxX/SURF4 family)